MIVFYQVCVVLLAVSVVSEAATLIANVSEGSPVYGVGKIREDVYVIHDSNSSIHVYDSSYNRFNLKRRMHTVVGMNGPHDMVVTYVAAVFKSAFIVDWFNASDVIRVNFWPSNTSKPWSFHPAIVTPVGLSLIQQSGNILLREYASAKIKEFSLTGSLVKSFRLKNITNPHQAIKISENRYAVCFGYNETTDKHQVCPVDGKGYTVGACFGDLAGNSTTQLNVPARLYKRRDGSILVADLRNKRILKLNPVIRLPAQVLVSKADGLSGPSRMFVDEDQNLLYVADNTLDPQTGYATKGRVLVYKI